MPVRSISVEVGDVFGHNGAEVAVIAVDTHTEKVTVRGGDDGRRRQIQIVRLQKEYPRASENNANAVLRALERRDKAAAKSAKKGRAGK